MAYTPTSYSDNSPPALNATNLNHSEVGIQTAQATADAAVPKSLVTTAGDLVYATASAVLARLGLGASGRVLGSNGTAPVWVDPNTLVLATTINSQGGSYTFVLSDQDKLVESTSAGAVNFTVPPNSSVPFPIGTTIEVGRYGAGEVTLVQGAGVTILSPLSMKRLNVQYAKAAIMKRATDEWWLDGDIKT